MWNLSRGKKKVKLLETEWKSSYQGLGETRTGREVTECGPLEKGMANKRLTSELNKHKGGK